MKRSQKKPRDLQRQPIDFGASAQGAVASNKEVIVELTSYRPRGAPWQGHEGLVNTGTKDRTQAQREATAQDPALVCEMSSENHQFCRHSASSLDNALQNGICWSQFCVMFEAYVMVLKLFIPKFPDHLQKLLVFFRLLLHQRPDLVVVVVCNGLFHSHRAGHGALFPKQGSSGAQCKPHHVPKGHQNGWPHPECNHQLIELFQVVLFLIPHFLNDRPDACPTQDGHLPCVDAVRSIFTRMIHPDYSIHSFPIDVV